MAPDRGGKRSKEVGSFLYPGTFTGLSADSQKVPHVFAYRHRTQALSKNRETSSNVREFEARLLSSTPVEPPVRDRILHSFQEAYSFRPGAVVNAVNSKPRPRAPGVQELLTGPPYDAKEWWAQQLGDGSRSLSSMAFQDTSDELESYRAPAANLISISRRSASAQSQVAWASGKHPWWSKFFRGWRRDNNHNTSISTSGGSTGSAYTPSVDLKHPAWKPVASSPCPGYSTPSLPSNSPSSNPPSRPSSSCAKKQSAARQTLSTPLQACLKRPTVWDETEATDVAVAQQQGKEDKDAVDLDAQEFHHVEEIGTIEKSEVEHANAKRPKSRLTVQFNEQPEEKQGCMTQVRPPSPHFTKFQQTSMEEESLSEEHEELSRQVSWGSETSEQLEEHSTPDETEQVQNEGFTARKSDHEAPAMPAATAKFSADDFDDSSSGTSYTSTLEYEPLTEPKVSNFPLSRGPQYAQAMTASKHVDASAREKALRLKAWAIADRYIGGQQRVDEYNAWWRKKHNKFMLKKADVSRHHGSRISGRRGTAFNPDNLSSLFSSAGRGTLTGSSSKQSSAASRGLQQAWKKFNSGMGSGKALSDARRDTIEEELPGQVAEGDEREAEGVRPLSQRRSLNTRFESLTLDEADSTPDPPTATAASGIGAKPSRASTGLRAAAERLRGRQGTQEFAGDNSSLADDAGSDAGTADGRNVSRERFSSGRGASRLDKTADTQNTSRAPAVVVVDPIVMARRFNFPLNEVKERLAEFNGLDREKRGVLSRGEFLEAVKRRLHMKDSNEIPQRMIREVWRATDSDGSGEIDFEEFLAWTQTVAFSEDLMITDPADQKIRELARRHNMPITTVEYIWREYDRCDCPNGRMNRECFTQLVEALLHAKEASDLPKGRLYSFWRAADAHRVGFIDFDQFLSWYIKYFAPVGTSSLGVDSPASSVYAKLGTNRFASYLSNFHLCEDAYTEEEAGSMKSAATAWQSLMGGGTKAP